MYLVIHYYTKNDFEWLLLTMESREKRFRQKRSINLKSKIIKIIVGITL